MLSNSDQPSFWNDLRSVAGYIIGFSYPLFGLSTGVRAVYQLFFKSPPPSDWGALLSFIAALIYIAATIGFFIRKPWSWRFAVAVLCFELVGILLVGSASLIIPEVIGRTAWSGFGADYGWFPLLQPILGLFWLFWKPAQSLYHVA